MKRLKLLSNKDLLTLLILANCLASTLQVTPVARKPPRIFQKGKNAADFQDLSFFSGYPSAENTYQPPNRQVS